MSDPPPPRLTLTPERLGEDLLVRAAGELDLGAENALISLAGKSLSVSRRLVLDLSEVTYIDSAGVQALVTLQGRLLGLELRSPSPVVATVLRLAGLDIWVTPDRSPRDGPEPT
jgi:anti-anti-sigma factor